MVFVTYYICALWERFRETHFARGHSGSNFPELLHVDITTLKFASFHMC